MNNDILNINYRNLYDSESSTDLRLIYDEYKSPIINNHKQQQRGGNNDDESEDKPNGGFPPIYVLEVSEFKKIEESKNRELVTRKASVSIKDILKSKKLKE
jgi:hypothetical protein